MFNKSKLQNAKLKISKLKEKYFNSVNGASSTDNIDVNESFTSTEVLFQTFKSEEDRFVKLSSPDQKPHSPVIIKVTVNDGDEDVNESISVNKHSFTSHIQHFPSVSSSPELSRNLSKVTSSHALKAESIVLSELSSQFEHICFLSSSSENEENTVHPASLTTPQSVIKSSLENPLGQSSDEDFSRNTLRKGNIKEHVDKKNKLNSDNELSEINSDDFSPILSEINLQKHTDSYQSGITIESQNSNDLSSKHNLTSSIDSESLIKFQEQAGRIQIERSDSKRYQLDPSSPSGDYLNSNKKLDFTSASDQKQRVPSAKTQFKNSRNKKYLRKEKTSEKTMTPFTTVRKKKKNRKIPKIRDNPLRHQINTDQRSDKITKSGDYNNKISISPLKITRHKYAKNPIHFEHSTGIEALAKRPLLKSCILVREDKIVSQITPSPSYGHLKNMGYNQLNGSDHNEVVSQLLRCQIQLTRRYIQNHHQMYLLCCQAVKLLSEEYTKKHRS